LTRRAQTNAKVCRSLGGMNTEVQAEAEGWGLSIKVGKREKSMCYNQIVTQYEEDGGGVRRR
jgi:hypothetical protein